MLFQTQGQAWVFLATMYAGLVLGALYSVNRMLRATLGSGRIISGVIDIIFWAAAALTMVCALYWAESGVIRIYMLLGFACGALLFELALGWLIMWIFRGICKLLHMLLNTRIMQRLFR